ncbi:MAG TPA: exodeoxyribonuclease III, partial [Candidatus Edwardsbacteria bacterium]|nr:exodeoxyribonuclease III [Candidatus Edwardsbacteria bacterium]
QADFGDFLLFNVYFPNGKASPQRLQYKMEFYEAFLDRMIKLLRAGKRIVVCGDVNTAHREIDLARPKENSKVSGFLPQEREWVDRFLAAGFVDTLRLFHPEGGLYSWWDVISRARERNVGWRIDYFYVSQNLKQRVADAYLLPEVTGSDHCPAGIDLKR